MIEPTSKFGKGLEPNTLLKAEGCDDLPAIKEEAYFVSCWQVSFWDRVKLLFSGRLYLWVWGQGHPPVAVTADVEIE